ncbi:hypothetical protein B0H14DRAFT_2558979 [Mycena olivaceomarginata]|nr:hypothetical protein B0H14DRAFT_2558979 [Mycena olivaceomarginata]
MCTLVSAPSPPERNHACFKPHPDPHPTCSTSKHQQAATFCVHPAAAWFPAFRYWLYPKDIPRSWGGCRRLSAAGIDDGCDREDEGGRKQQNKMGITDQHLRIAMMDPIENTTYGTLQRWEGIRGFLQGKEDSQEDIRDDGQVGQAVHTAVRKEMQYFQKIQLSRVAVVELEETPVLRFGDVK